MAWLSCHKLEHDHELTYEQFKRLWEDLPPDNREQLHRWSLGHIRPGTIGPEEHDRLKRLAQMTGG